MAEQFRKGKKSPLLEVRQTGKYGAGVFATEDIKKGTIIHILAGEKVSHKEALRRVLGEQENLDDIFQIGKRTYIDLNEHSRIFNHSCDPNAGLRKTSEMFALRDIKKGEEITYDYSLTIAPTEWEMKCKCGSPKCRGILGDITSIPKKQLERYEKMGAIQKYMQPILIQVKNKIYKMPKYEMEALEKLKTRELKS